MSGLGPRGVNESGNESMAGVTPLYLYSGRHHT